MGRHAHYLKDLGYLPEQHRLFFDFLHFRNLSFLSKFDLMQLILWLVLTLKRPTHISVPFHSSIWHLPFVFSFSACPCGHSVPFSEIFVPRGLKLHCFQFLVFACLCVELGFLGNFCFEIFSVICREDLQTFELFQ